MATFVIGDIQGCYKTLVSLLRRIGFDRRQDRLWLVGDLVNRGTGSLEVLRWAVEQEDRITCVLGNHDLHLLSRAWGVGRRRPTDTLEGILEDPDREDLLRWLRQRPFLHRENETMLVHAGLLPEWTPEKAQSLAQRAERALRGPEGPLLLNGLHSHSVPPWDSPEPLAGARGIVAGLVRLRFLKSGGEMDLEFKGPPDAAPEGLIPWFEVTGRKTAGETVFFGHWSALGLMVRPRVVALDTGCYLGRSLTACRLDDRTIFQEFMDPLDRPNM